MKQLLNQSQPSARIRDTWDQPEMSHYLQRMELLLPEIACTSLPDMLSYAVAYVERYQGDILQLEHEKDFLYAALTLAWQRAAFPIVVRLVEGLAHIAGRFSNFAQVEHMLRMGIEASRCVQDKRHLASFLNRLGGLLYVRGRYQQGWRAWHLGLQIAETAGSYLGLWEPLCSFVHTVDILRDYATAQQFVETRLRTRWIDDPDSAAVMFFVRGFYARNSNFLDRAYDDFRCCLQLLSCQPVSTPPTAYRQLFTMVAQAELARAQGDYRRSQEYTESALALAQVFSDAYTVATLLIDQANFTYRRGKYADTYAASLRLREVVREVEAPHPYQVSGFFEQQLTKILAESSHLPQGQRHAPDSSTLSIGDCELSEREVEVLRLVAEGLSNRAIARRLVITVGTAKKHLEHIYMKLDVHSRTAAIASARSSKLLH